MGVSDYDDLLHLVKKLESKESMGLDEYEIKNCIKAWSVSHSTLEEVFMKVSKEKEEWFPFRFIIKVIIIKKYNHISKNKEF